MLLFEKDFPANICYDSIIADFCSMSGKVNHDYIEELFYSEDPNQVVLFNLESSNEFITWPCGLIYKIVKMDGVINICILYVATKYKYRGMGYASLFLKEIINHFSDKYMGEKVNIVLDGIYDSVTFYEHFGFKWEYGLTKYDDIFSIDDKNRNEHFIMCLYLYT